MQKITEKLPILDSGVTVIMFGEKSEGVVAA